MKKATLVASAAAVLSSLVACGPSQVLPGSQVRPGTNVGSFNNGPVRTNGKKWTIGVFIAGDNNLYSAALKDVNEMEAAFAKNPAAAEQIDVIVFFDGSPKGDSKILRIKPDPMNSTIVSEEIDSQGLIPASKEVDSGDPALFAKFADFLTKNFPAQYNSISGWNHGGGIFRNDPGLASGNFMDSVVGGGSTGQRVRGISSKVFLSDDNGGEMHLKDLQPILSAGTKNLGKPFDIFGFDTCLMQTVETAYQLKGQANIFVASEELEPGDGWDYQAYLGALTQNPNMNPVDLSKVMVDTYIKSYMPGGSQRGRDVTLAAVDVNAVVSKLAPAISEFGASLQASLPTEKAAIAAARSKTQTFYLRDAADLGHFVKLYAPTSRNPRVGAAAAKLDQAMKQSLIAEGHFSPAVANATGFQIYFPNATMSMKPRYLDPSEIMFAETKGWGSFLSAFTAK